MNEVNIDQSDRIKLLKIELNKQIKENDILKQKIDQNEKREIHNKNKYQIELKLVQKQQKGDQNQKLIRLERQISHLVKELKKY